MKVAADTAAPWLSLSLLRLKSTAMIELLRHFETPQAVLNASADALSRYLKPAQVKTVTEGPDPDQLQMALQWLSAEDNNHIVTLADQAYPQALLNSADPPFLLYLKGNPDLLNRPALAIVGSRNATPGGLHNAREFAHELSQSGLSIVSGLAHGIDAAAHQGALAAQGDTVAVVGTGLDRVYPAANRDLAHQIVAKGALVSEFPLGTAPRRPNFPLRNRIISGMSLGCLVIEASVQSGSLITARLATEQGRDVFAVPGSIHSPQSKGCHQLIKQGAKLVDSVQDILDELAVAQNTETVTATACTNKEPPSNNSLVDQMGFDPVDLDTLSARCNLTISELSAMLLTLELSGQVTVLPGGRYQRLH